MIAIELTYMGGWGSISHAQTGTAADDTHGKFHGSWLAHGKNTRPCWQTWLPSSLCKSWTLMLTFEQNTKNNWIAE